MSTSTAAPKGNKSKKPGDSDRIIARNRRATHDYHISEKFEAGLMLEGWEVKALRAGKGQIAEAYVQMHRGEAWLIGAHISPLLSASTHVSAISTRKRKLLLHAKELSKLIGATERQGYTIIPLDLHWTRGRAKLEIGLAKGKKQHDKRADIKQRDWDKQKARILKDAAR